MNVETPITKKGWNDKVRACNVINVVSKKFSPKEAPDGVAKLNGEKIFLPKIIQSRPSFFLVFFSPALSLWVRYRAH